MSNKAALFAGALGGVAPNLVRLGVNYTSTSPQPIQPVSYFLAMLLFAVLGALVVWVFQENNLQRALFLGIGLPSLFQTASLQSIPPSTSPPSMAPGTQASMSLVSSAYAQSPPPSPSVATRTLNVSADRKIAFTVAFYGMNNSLISSAPVTNSGTVTVPKDAVKFAVQIGGSTSTSYELPNTSAALIKADVKINEKPNTGFFQGLGLTKAAQYDINVRVQ